MKLISCISWWLDRPDLEMRSVDDVTNVRDEEAVSSCLVALLLLLLAASAVKHLKRGWSCVCVLAR